ncbi:MAG TPA: cupin domain-containing protein [Thermoanaerobaculia bacterium]|nr:cupin domain-containing protein [Thermoanaerobaculia bacterium]
MRAYLLDQPNHSYGADDLRQAGVLHWQLPLPGSEAEIERIKRDRGYVEQDEVSLSPETPNLDAICAKFDKEHYHTLDEVRFVVDGEGIFDVRDSGDRWVRIEVDAGDLIIIPARMYHRFYLTAAKNIRCVRLFLNQEGWAPLYREAAVPGGR